MDNVDFMAAGPDGTVYVGSKEQGKLYALPDRNRDGRADEVITLATTVFQRSLGV